MFTLISYVIKLQKYTNRNYCIESSHGKTDYNIEKHAYLKAKSNSKSFKYVCFVFIIAIVIIKLLDGSTHLLLQKKSGREYSRMRNIS